MCDNDGTHEAVSFQVRMRTNREKLYLIDHLHLVLVVQVHVEAVLEGQAEVKLEHQN